MFMALHDTASGGQEMLNSRPMAGSSALQDAGRRIVRFGIFEADLQAGELRRDGLRVKLQEQPFQVLRLLLERPGETVTRDELQRRLWPADTFVDFDRGLNAAIKRLRDALGDSAENPRFVETLSRRGYRFVAPVDRATPVAGVQVVATLPQHRSTDPRRWWIVGALATLLLALGISLGLYFGSRAPAASAVTSRRVTANPPDDPVSGAAISPDGRYLAFSDDTGFYLRQIDTGETHPLWTPPGLKLRPGCWYPDGTHMVVTGQSKPGEPFGLWQISVLGGNPRRLSEQGWHPAMSPDGTKIAFLKGGSMNERVWVMQADGTQPQQLAGAEGDYFGLLAWAPDSKRLAYAKGHFALGVGTKASIEVVYLKQTRREVILSLPRLGAALGWTTDDRLIYSMDESPPNQSDSNLWWVHLNRNGQPSGTPVRLTGEPGAIAGISLSADGKRLAFLKEAWQPDVYVADVEAGGKKISEPQRLTPDERRDFPYDWTTDGKQVIFTSDRSGTFQIYRQATDRTTPEVIVGGQESLAIPRLTPDGTQVLFLVYPQTGDRSATIPIMRVPLAGGPPQKVLEAPEIINHQCARLPATTCVYSQASENALTFFTFDPFQGRQKQVLEIKDDLPYAYNWSLSPDGTTLAIAKKLDPPAEASIRLVSILGGADRVVTLQEGGGIGGLDWAADGKSLWFTGVEKSSLWNVDLQGRAVPVWQARNMYVGWAIPSRDGRKIALWQASSTSNVGMLENF